MNQNKLINHDGVIYHPLGGGSYIFKKDIVNYLSNRSYKDGFRISIGAQPNSTPHLGTLAVFSLAFSLGKRFREREKPDTRILFEVVDTAPSETKRVGDVYYQRSLRESGKADLYLPYYERLLGTLESISNVPYDIRRQKDFNSSKNIPGVLKKILKNREEVASILDPEKELLRLRITCPECGFSDKKGMNNRYRENAVESLCPEHGWFETNIEKDQERLEYNTPLRNLVRAIVYGEDNRNEDIPLEWMRVTGNDYAGFYQEQLLYNSASVLDFPITDLPKIIYTPLITDWSGAKLSKSLYVVDKAYDYLPKFLIDFEGLLKEFGDDGVKWLFDETIKWVDEPFRLFRDYSVYYFMELFEEKARCKNG